MLKHKLADLPGHVGQRTRVTFFCKLCREHDIKQPKAHLVNVHKTSRKAMDRPSSDQIVKDLFVENQS